MDAHLSLSSCVVLNPRRAGLRAGEDNVVEVLVRVQAPDAPAGHVAQRPPQAVALVLDRSGSMAGRPLAEALRCAEHVVARLRPSDSVALVQFDNRVRRLWPAVPVGDGAALRAAIATIAAGGNTNLHGGWREGADCLGDVAGSGLKRVILLSDGQANEGLVDPTAIAAQCAELAARGITTSTYGLGRKFNEELMVAMARAGGGNSYYGDRAEDLMEPFEQELELLGNLCLRELRLSLWVPDGAVAEVLNAPGRSDGGWRLPDLAWGAEAWAVVRVALPAGMVGPSGSSMPVLRASVTGLSLQGEDAALERVGLALPVLSALAHGALVDDALVDRRLVELAAAEALAAVRTAASQGRWSDVDRLLEEAARRFAGNAWVAAMLEAMTHIADARSEQRLLKEAMYSSDKLRNRLASKEEQVALANAQEAAREAAYLRRKPLQGTGDA